MVSLIISSVWKYCLYTYVCVCMCVCVCVCLLVKVVLLKRVMSRFMLHPILFFWIKYGMFKPNTAYCDISVPQLGIRPTSQRNDLAPGALFTSKFTRLPRLFETVQSISTESWSKHHSFILLVSSVYYIETTVH